MEPQDIVISESKLEPAEVRRLAALYFGDMVKFVVDLDRRVIAVGGELHADAEALLLQRGSQQANLWGGNYYPGKGEVRCLEYTALINIRPTSGNPGMEVLEDSVRTRIRELVFALIGRGGEKP
jgi:hypothetical protein